MRIAFISPVLGEGFGTERVVRHSAALLEEAGHETFFVTSSLIGPPPSQPTKLVAGLDNIFLRSSPARSLKVHQEALSFLETQNPDLVHFADLFDFRFVLRVARRFPIVLTAHTVAPSCPASSRHIPEGICSRTSGWECLKHHRSYGCLGFLKNDFRRALAVADYLTRRFGFKRHAHVAAISRYVQKTLIEDGWSADKVNLVYNPVSLLQKATPLSHVPENLLVIAARLVPLKGIDLVLRALAPLKARPWTLWICGEGPLRSSLEQLCLELGLSQRVRFMGRLPAHELQSVFATATAVIQANLGPEGFGLAIAEASLAGAPVIAFDVPALNELVSPGETGLLVERANTQALTEAIAQLIESPSLIRRFRENGPEYIKKMFSPEKHLHATLDVYRNALSSEL